jgi:hypothetical protein
MIYFILRRLLFEKEQHLGECGLTGRFANIFRKPPRIESQQF